MTNDKITTIQFDEILEDLVREHTAWDIVFTIPGVYDLVSEYFNNDVLDIWEASRHIDEDVEEDETLSE